ncbi:MAG: hypothetical protein AAGA56_11640 [Myxococcota bacterium]
MVLECVEVLCERFGDDFEPLVEHIKVERLPVHEFEMAAVKACGLVVMVPEARSNRTHVLAGSTEDLEVTYLRTISGLPWEARKLLPKS